MQKFHTGDWVRVAKDLGPTMRHFTADCEAIVIGSYADQCGGGNHNSYTLYLKGRGICSWYYGEQLTLLEAGRLDKLQAWREEAEAKRKQKSDLDWIFANGQAVAKNPHSASIQALAECLGLTNLWGRHGEGITYYDNTRIILIMATPFLKTCDKAGWLALCSGIKADAEHHSSERSERERKAEAFLDSLDRLGLQSEAELR